VSNNTVDIDPVALAADAERALAGATMEAAPTGADPAAPAGAVDALTAQSWRPLIEGLTPTVRMTIFAQWSIRPDMEQEFIGSLSQSLDLLFPGGLDGKWAPFARLLACCAGIVFLNYTANGNKLPPLGLKKPDAEKRPADTEQRKAA
jgi:hypothetical protein